MWQHCGGVQPQALDHLIGEEWAVAENCSWLWSTLCTCQKSDKSKHCILVHSVSIFQIRLELSRDRFMRNKSPTHAGFAVEDPQLGQTSLSTSKFGHPASKQTKRWDGNLYKTWSITMFFWKTFCFRGFICGRWSHKLHMPKMNKICFFWAGGLIRASILLQALRNLALWPGLPWASGWGYATKVSKPFKSRCQITTKRTMV